MKYEELLRRAKENLPKVDEESRFKMPDVVVIVVGKQTIIKNFLDIAKSLRREPKDIAKYLFKQLAVPGELKGRELIFQGKLNTDFVKQRVKKYAEEFVKCQECGKYDTKLEKNEKIIIIKCEACGAKRTRKA